MGDLEINTIGLADLRDDFPLWMLPSPLPAAFSSFSYLNPA
jgi:hypothetical protein